MSPEELDEIQERADKASTDWVADVYRETAPSGNFMITGGRVTREDGSRLVTDHVHSADDAEFIAAARTDVPKLLAALRDAQAREARALGLLHCGLADEHECCDHSGVDEYGCSDCYNTGHSHGPCNDQDFALAALAALSGAVQEGSTNG